MPFRRVWVAGWREGVLARLVQEYKYQAVRAVGRELEEILDAILPKTEELKKMGWRKIVVVPLPTIGRHVRERGLDHTNRLARGLAKRRGWEYRRMLERAADTVQVGTKAALRKAQAARAYEVRGKTRAEETYLLLDDVWTTGASMLAAAEVMQTAGAEKILGVVLATGRKQEENDEANLENA